MAPRNSCRVASILCLCWFLIILPDSRVSAVPFIRGDVDANGRLEIADAVRVFGFLFLGSPNLLFCKDAADANDSGEVDLSDGVYILAHLFLGGPAPPAPFPDCGADSTDDSLDCRLYGFCPVPFCDKTFSEDTSADVGGFRLKYKVIGHGCPAIVMDAGFGDTGTSTFNGVLPGLASIGRTLVYNRAGTGGSEIGPEPRTNAVLMAELHTLLAKVGFEPPYILVGHSYGGYNIRVFANLYPAEVVGMVFVDPAHEDFYRKFRESYPAAWDALDRFDDALFANRDPGPRAERKLWKDARFNAPDPIVDVPIVVLTALNPDLLGLVTGEAAAGFVQIWDEAHETLARSVTLGTHIRLPGIGHFIHQERPQVVIDAIQQVVDEAR